MTQRIDPSEIICGLPALDARGALRDIAQGRWPLGEASAAGDRLLARFVRDGYLEKADRALVLTDKGAMFVRGRATPGFNRKTCERALERVLARAADINSNPRRGSTVENVVVFGSFLGDKEMLGDLDIMVRWGKRYPSAVNRKLTEERRRVGRLLGQQINLVDYYQWDWIDARRYLKGRGPVISMEPYDQPFLADIPHRILQVPTPTVLDVGELFLEGRSWVRDFVGTPWAVRDQILVLLAGVMEDLQQGNAYLFGDVRDDLIGDIASDNWWAEPHWDGREMVQYPLAVAWTRSGQNRFLGGEGRFPFWCFGPATGAPEEQATGKLLAALRRAGIPDAFIAWSGDVNDAVLVGPLYNSWTNMQSEMGVLNLLRRR